jgi:hypothetical protein
MTSKVDTLKLAVVDLDEVKGVLGKADNALRGNGIYGRNPNYHVRLAVQALEKIDRRLRRSFMNGETNA